MFLLACVPGPRRVKDRASDTARCLLSTSARGTRLPRGKGPDLRARELADLVGSAALTPLDQQHLRLEAAFEAQLENQGHAEKRDLVQTLTRAWQVLAALPRRQLAMLPADMLDAWYPGGDP